MNENLAVGTELTVRKKRKNPQRSASTAVALHQKTSLRLRPSPEVKKLFSDAFTNLKKIDSPNKATKGKLLMSSGRTQSISPTSNKSMNLKTVVREKLNLVKSKSRQTTNKAALRTKINELKIELS